MAVINLHILVVKFACLKFPLSIKAFLVHYYTCILLLHLSTYCYILVFSYCLVYYCKAL